MLLKLMYEYYMGKNMFCEATVTKSKKFIHERQILKKFPQFCILEWDSCV